MSASLLCRSEGLFSRVFCIWGCDKLLGWRCLLFFREGGGCLYGKAANVAKHPMADGSGLSHAIS